MSTATANCRDHPKTLLAVSEIVADRRADGSIWLRSAARAEADA